MYAIDDTVLRTPIKNATTGKRDCVLVKSTVIGGVNNHLIHLQLCLNKARDIIMKHSQNTMSGKKIIWNIWNDSQ